jgi:hypothetical protein
MFSSHLQLNPQFWNLSTIIYSKSRSHELTHGHTMSSAEHIVIDRYISPLNGNPMSNLHTVKPLSAWPTSENRSPDVTEGHQMACAGQNTINPDLIFKR